jgi:hypothetical protein
MGEDERNNPSNSERARRHDPGESSNSSGPGRDHRWSEDPKHPPTSMPSNGNVTAAQPLNSGAPQPTDSETPRSGKSVRHGYVSMRNLSVPSAPGSGPSGGTGSEPTRPILLAAVAHSHLPAGPGENGEGPNPSGTSRPRAGVGPADGADGSSTPL